MAPHAPLGDAAGSSKCAPWMARLGVALVALLLSACGVPQEPALPPGAVVLILGDSISAGYGVESSQAWPGLLAARSGWNVVNGGVSGDTSADALARLPELLDQHAPALVLLEIGGNDMLRGIPEAQTQANLGHMIELVKQRGTRAVVMAVPRPSVAGAVFSSLEAAGFYRAVAQRADVPLLEDALSDVLSERELKLDPLHPNAAGHLALAHATAAALKRIGILR